jgi:hypothetical protein
MKFTGKEILGMIHLSGPSPIKKALEEIEIYERQGLYGVIIENYHGSVNDVIYTLKELKKLPKTKLKIGINILPNEFNKSFEIANEYDVDFIQFDYLGVKENDIRVYMNHYINTNIFIIGGVWPKYYSPIKGSDLNSDINEGLLISNGIVVTGKATGIETDLGKIIKFREFMDFKKSKKPLIIGAGLNNENVKEQMSYADGAIVGSYFKPNGNTTKKVDEKLVKKFINSLNN